MRRVLLTIVVLLLLLTGPGFAALENINIIPRPDKITEIEGSDFVITSSTKIIVDEMTAPVGKYFAKLIKPATGFDLKVIDQKDLKDLSGGMIILAVTKKPKTDIGDEGYFLSTTPFGVAISAKTAQGVFYGCQTLRQLLPAEIESKTKVKNIKWTVPPVRIQDQPRFGYRGMHLDVARHFEDAASVKKYIDYLAMHKMNRFHWHLTEDQGWRIEIKKYPKLTEISAWRDQTVIGKNTGKYDGKKHGGFYTQDEIRDVVKYAAERYVTVIPEIELPGHSLAALAAYPELGCTGGPYKVAQTWGVFKEVYCAGDEKTFEFLQDVLTEVIDLFPGTYIHIGGDECPKASWKVCPKCQKRIKDEGLHNEHELQSYFIKRIEKFLNSKGRKIIGWDEILEGGLAPEATVMSWRGEAGGIAAAKEGHDVIMTPNSHCYFDHYQGTPANEPLAIGGFLPLEKVYSYEPIPAVLNAQQAKHILGAQANIWTEYIPNFAQVEYMLLPRACALAEVVWSKKENKNYEDFSKRLAYHLSRLDYIGANYRLPGPAGLQKSYVFEKDVTIDLTASIAGATVRYTTDGNEPTAKSPVFKGPLKVDSNMTIKARTVTKSGKLSPIVTGNFRKQTMQKAVDPGVVKPGITFAYYETGSLNKVPDFKNMTAKKTGVQKDFALPQSRPDNFAVAYDGYIKIETDGIYTFYTSSDDGSVLYIDGAKIVDNDGLHGGGDLVRGQVLLQKGMHKIHVGYFEAGEAESLKVVYEGPGVKKQNIPAKVLFTN
ncbi:MAG: family 20 glycosylhydrolase [Phycisphaerae bacterium]|nr:family 20 glycosylhydrolase [Phycisphaerae bacterium]